MSEPFIGQIVMFAGNFAPRGWALCDGQLLPIAQNQALFSLLGTTYGGDGRTTFALPDLRGRVPLHAGTGPGLTPRRLGEMGGAEAVTLSASQLPAHGHPATATVTARCNKGKGTADGPEGKVWAGSSEGDQTYHATPNASLAPGALEAQVSVGDTGEGAAHENAPPFQCVNFIIALQGIYPSRN